MSRCRRRVGIFPYGLSARCETGVISHDHGSKHPSENALHPVAWHNLGSRAPVPSIGREPMIEVCRLGHATLTTPDLDRQVAYYTAVVGLTLVERDAKRTFLASKQGLEAVALEPGAPNALSRLAVPGGPGSGPAAPWRGPAEHRNKG